MSKKELLNDVLNAVILEEEAEALKGNALPIVLRIAEFSVNPR